MPEKDAENVSSLISLLPVLYALFWSAIAGTVRYLNTINRRHIPFRIFGWFTEMLTSVFVGFVAFASCETADLGLDAKLVIVCLSAHMGTDALKNIFRIVMHSHGYIEDERRKNENGDSNP